MRAEERVQRGDMYRLGIRFAIEDVEGLSKIMSFTVFNGVC